MRDWNVWNDNERSNQKSFRRILRKWP
jgi:hypothetical protein